MVKRGQIKHNRTQNFRQQKIYLEKRTPRKRDYGKFTSLLSFKRVVLVLAVIIFGWWILFSNSFTVKDVIVQGNNLIPMERISSIVPSNKNIFLLSNSAIEKKIKADIPEVSDVQVYKGFPDAIKVVVVEYDQSVIWKSGENYYLLDSQGRVYKDISNDLTKFSNLPVVDDTKQMKFELGQQIVSPGFVAFVENINSNISESANLQVDHFAVSETTFDLNLYTKEVIYIKFDTTRSSKKQLEDVKTVMIQKGGDIKEYLDVRVDGWAYYK